MRQLNNWLDAYLEYLENTEPARQFQTWVGLSVIAACLRKKVHLELGRIKIFPNMYIVLVSDPGIARKSQSITYGVRFLSQVPEIAISADATTREAMLDDLEKCAVDELMPDGSTFRHASLTVTSKEFETFLGQKKENTKMLVLLTDLFDCEELPWRYRTKHSGSNTIPSVFFNLVAATTPDSLASSLPSTAIGGGLTTRILFIWADGKYKKVPVPVESDREIEIKEKLLKDLYVISRIAGSYTFDRPAENYWNEWYMAFEEGDRDRLCLDPSFAGWYSRKPTYVLKTCMLLSACEHSNLIIERRYIERAIQMVESVESSMAKAFRGVGRSPIAADVSNFVSIVKQQIYIPEREMAKIMWRDADADTLDRVRRTACDSHMVYQRQVGGVACYVTPDKAKEIDAEQARASSQRSSGTSTALHPRSS